MFLQKHCSLYSWETGDGRLKGILHRNNVFTAPRLMFNVQRGQGSTLGCYSHSSLRMEVVTHTIYGQRLDDWKSENSPPERTDEEGGCSNTTSTPQRVTSARLSPVSSAPLKAACPCSSYEPSDKTPDPPA
ncbi:unnamed protein product [Gadus morhua 'NCC']